MSSEAEGAEVAGTGVLIGLEAAAVSRQQPVAQLPTLAIPQRSHVSFSAIFLPGKIALTSVFGELLKFLFCLLSRHLMVRGGILRK